MKLHMNDAVKFLNWVYFVINLQNAFNKPILRANLHEKFSHRSTAFFVRSESREEFGFEDKFSDSRRSVTFMQLMGKC